VQYNEDGTLDNNFGKNGVLMFGAWDSLRIYRLALQSDGKMLAEGDRKTSTGRVGFIKRYLPDLKVSSIDLFLKNDAVLVYPNPIKDVATLEYSLEKPEILTIQLTDLNGQILKTYLQNQPQKAGTYQQQIDLSTGMYLVRLSSPNGQMMIKVVK